MVIRAQNDLDPLKSMRATAEKSVGIVYIRAEADTLARQIEGADVETSLVRNEKAAARRGHLFDFSHLIIKFRTGQSPG